MPCAISVAHATPATPIVNSFTKKISSAMLNNEEKINRYNGIWDFPSALNMADKILYINRNGSPRK